MRALNKSGGNPQLERKPIDVRAQRQSRKRAREAAQINLHSIHTPLVEAHRPSKKRTAEAERLRKTYKAAARKSRVPETIHAAIEPAMRGDDSVESCD